MSHFLFTTPPDMSSVEYSSILDGRVAVIAGWRYRLIPHCLSRGFDTSRVSYLWLAWLPEVSSVFDFLRRSRTVKTSTSAIA